MNVPQATLETRRMLMGCASNANAITTLTQLTQKPVTKGLGGASSVCITLRVKTASFANMGIMEMLCSRIVESVFAIIWAQYRSTVMALTVSVTR